jgi:type II secretion system protein N
MQKRTATMLKLGLGFGLVLRSLTGCASGPPPAESGPPPAESGPPPVAKGAFKIEDVVQTTDDAIRVQVNRREVPLREMPMASLLAGLPMTGLADVAIDLTIPGADGKHDYQKAAGSISLGCPTGCTIGDDAARLQPAKTWDPAGIPFGHVTFDKVDLRAEVQQGHLKVTRWQLESKDLMLDLRLDIGLAADLDSSTLDGCLRFRPSPSLEQRDPRTAAAIAMTGASRGKDGVYSIKIEGRVGQRKLLSQACT